MSKKKEIVESSGNIYEDLNYKDSEEMQAKANLACEIYLVIRKKKLTQQKAAKLLGLTQPKVSNLINGKLSGFSVERLIHFLNILDCDVEITVKDKPKNRKRAHTYVFSERQTHIPRVMKGQA